MALRSIRTRLAAVFSMYLAFLMIAAVTGLIWYSKRAAERNANSLLAATARRTVAESQVPASPAKLIAEEREDLVGTELAMNILDSKGHIIAKTQKNASVLPLKNGEDWRIVTSKLKNGDIVVVGMPWKKTHRALRYHAMTLIFLGAFVVVIASAGSWFLVGRSLRPIPLLARQAMASSADNLAISLKPPSQDREMIELVDTLNGLLRRVTETASAKGRFYSAASHELRTPLQALSGHLELALSRDRTKEEYRAAAEEAYSQARRLISLVRALLFLYQLDSSVLLPPKEPIDLVEVCKRSLSHFEPAISQRGLQVTVRTPEEAEMLSPPTHVEMLVRNLVENAVKYTPENGHVDMTVAVDSDIIRLEVLNDCASHQQWKADEMFEPFSRPDSSRNSKSGGTGLGLAICKSIADANGWHLDIQAELESVRMTFVIPCCVQE